MKLNLFTKRSLHMVYSDTEQVLIFLRQQMLARKITIKELALKMNKSASAVGMLFRQSNVSLETLHELSQALDYDLELNFIEKK